MIPVQSAKAFFAWLITWLAAIKLIADSLSGALLRSGSHGTSVSVLYGAILGASLFLYLSAKNKILFLIVVTIWMLLVITGWGPPSPFQSYEFRWAMNSSFIFLSFLAFREILSRDPRGFGYCVKVAAVSYFILLANLIAGWLGIGASQYQGRIGAIGFLYAGNEMSVALVAAIAILTVFSVTSNRLKLFYLVILPTAIGGAVLKVTKTAMLGILIITLVFPVILKGRKAVILALRRIIRPSRLLWLLLLAVPLILFGAYELGLFARLSYWGQRLDLATLMFSHRNVYATQAIAYVQENFNALNVLFGSGTRWISTMGHIVEIDPVDFFMTYGVVGMILGYLPFLAAIVLCCLRLMGDRQNASEARFGLVVMLIFVAISATAGHVLSSGTSGLLLGIILALSSVDRYHGVIFSGKRAHSTICIAYLTTFRNHNGRVET